MVERIESSYLASGRLRALRALFAAKLHIDVFSDCGLKHLEVHTTLRGPFLVCSISISNWCWLALGLVHLFVYWTARKIAVRLSKEQAIDVRIRVIVK